MYGKKLLSVAALLFTFYNVSKVRAQSAASAATIVSCPGGFVETNNCIGEETEKSLCIKGNKIYSYDNSEEGVSDKCYVGVIKLLNEGINVISVDNTRVTVTTETLGETFSELENLAIYNCDSSDCTQTYGYIKERGGYIEVSVSEQSKRANVDELATNEKDCSGKVGKLIKPNDQSNIYLCLTADKSVQVNVDDDEEETYLMDNVVGNIFTNANSDDSETYPNIAILNAKKALIFNKDYTDDEYCVYDSNLMMDRIDSFCDNQSILNNLYTCGNGLCEVIHSPVGAGNYIVDSTLYKCTGDTNTVSCAKDGDLEDQGVIIVEVQSNKEGYTFNKVITTAEMGGNPDLSKIHIYDCVAGTCQKTDGMIQYASNTGYCTSDGDCSGTSPTLTVEGSITYDTDSNQFKYSNPNTSEDILIDNDKEYFFTYNNNYILIHTNSAKNVIGYAENARDSVVYIVQNNKIISEEEKDCILGAKKYTVTVSGGVRSINGEECPPPAASDCTTVDVGNTGNCVQGYYVVDSGNVLTTSGTSGKLYYCKTGKCEELTADTDLKLGVGYYKNGAGNADSYISCVDDGTCTVVVVEKTAANCNEIDAGKLYKDSDDDNKIKLCVEDKDQDGIPLTTAGKQYVVSIAAKGTAFGGQYGQAGKFVIIDFDGVNVIKNVVDDIPYRYTDPANSRVISRSDASKSGICDSREATPIPEYKKVSDDGIYERTNPTGV